MTENLSRDRFAEHLNTDFTFYFSNGVSAPAKLIEVSEVRRSRSEEGFAIVFLTPADAPISQEQLRVEHPAMGTFELFVVPIGRTDAGLKYEAIFNRAVD